MVGFLVVVLGATLWLDGNPEFERVTSADGALTVEGSVPGSVAIRVIQDKDASSQAWTAVRGDVYVIEPDGVWLPAPVSIVMETLEDQGPLTIGYFDTELGAWVPVDTRLDAELGILVAQTYHFSHWARLLARDVQMRTADAQELFADVEASAPPGVNGYQVDLAYATQDGDYVLFDEEADRRRCIQPVTVRERSVQTALDRTVPILIDGELRSANVRAIVHWEIGSGCSQLIDPQPEQTRVIE